MRTAVSAATGEAELLKSSSKEGFVQCDLAREVIGPFSLFSRRLRTLAWRFPPLSSLGAAAFHHENSFTRDDRPVSLVVGPFGENHIEYFEFKDLTR